MEQFNLPLSLRRQARLFVASLTVVLLLGVGAGTASADAVYHTERLTFSPVAEGEAGRGHVVNIHANGPINFGFERYQLIDAQPNTEYSVWLQVGGQDFVSTNVIRTNKAGNGKAKFGVPPELVAGLAGQVLPVNWVLRTDDGVDAYVTEVTLIAID